jgi:DNA polymerase-4
MTRKILHLDLDAFFCSVEENNDPSLRGKPFAVGGQPGERGVVASCSYAARMYGVHSAMAMGRALRLCPNLIIISHRHADYGNMSKKVMAYLKTLTPLIEQISIDEAFLDLSDLPDAGEILAISIQKYIWENFNLPCSIGVATNKLVAKIATDVGKASKRSSLPPRAIKVVPPGYEAEFLAPLPTQALWGIGPKTSARLASLGIHTIGDIVLWPKEERNKHLGKYGDDLYKRAQGIDESVIHTSHGVKSVSNETTFARDVDDLQTLYETLHKLSESVGRRLRKKNLSGNTIKLKLRWHNFTTFSRQITLSNSTNDDYEIYSAVKELFNSAWQKGKPVRLLGVGVTNFENNPHQLSLWDKTDKKDSNLLNAVDSIRDRYGKNTIMRGSDLKFPKPSRNNDE